MRLELAARSRQHILPIILLSVPQPSSDDEMGFTDTSLAPALHFLNLKLPVSQFRQLLLARVMSSDQAEYATAWRGW
jgi:hypothetical protein